MAITFSCACGENYTVADMLAGNKFQCLACQKELLVPNTTAVDEDLVEDLEIEEESGSTYGFAGDYSAGKRTAEDIQESDAIDEPEFVEDDDELPEYFVAAFPPGDRTLKPKTFRIYPYHDELLVVHAGPFSWGVVRTLLDRPGVREEIRKGTRRSGDLSTGGGADANALRELAKRAAVLDRMTLDELRTETEAEKHSFRISTTNTSDVCIQSKSSGGLPHREHDAFITGRLKFTHATAGHRELAFISKADVRYATTIFRQVLGIKV